MTKFDIQIVSDVVCPWCYVGKRRLERAVELYKKVVPGGKDDTFVVTWRPFYLDSNLPKVGVDRSAHLAKKYGADKVEMIHKRLTNLGSADGINFSLKGKIGNTRDAHRLIQLAKTKSSGVQDKTVTELFRSHFEHDGDVTSHDMLADAAERAGLDRAETRAWLDGEDGGQEVDRDVQEAYARGVHGVPSFTINGRYQVEGAQDVGDFLDVLVKAKEAAPGLNSQSAEGTHC